MMASTKPMFYCPKCDIKNATLLCPRCESVGIIEKSEGAKIAEAEMQQASNNLKMTDFENEYKRINCATQHKII